VFGRSRSNNDFDMGMLLCKLDQILLDIFTKVDKKKAVAVSMAGSYEGFRNAPRFQSRRSTPYPKLLVIGCLEVMAKFSDDPIEVQRG